jgi:hypothetical protein
MCSIRWISFQLSTDPLVARSLGFLQRQTRLVGRSEERRDRDAAGPRLQELSWHQTRSLSGLRSSMSRPGEGIDQAIDKLAETFLGREAEGREN